MSAAAGTVSDRSTRRVQRLHLVTPDRSLAFRAQNLVNEALRLCSLPGEEQGRVYFFRRLRLPPLGSGADAAEWVRSATGCLLAASERAVHGLEPRARAASAVYFHDLHEAERTLFVRLVRAMDASEWFWPAASGVPLELPHAERSERLLESWARGPLGWAAVARELLPALDVNEIEVALALIRPDTAERWLSELPPITQEPSAKTPDPPPLSVATRALLTRVRALFGAGDPRAIWLTTLLVLGKHPTLSQDASLRQCATRTLALLGRAANPTRDARGRALTPPNDARPLERDPPQAEPSPREPARARPPNTASEARAPRADAETRAAREGPALLELPSGFAGLYFLLHPLRHLGIEEAIAAHPELASTGFVARLLLRLARGAGVVDGDPILAPCIEAERDSAADPLVVPRGLRAPETAPKDSWTERAWSYAVRRWCHQRAKVPVRALIVRPGRVHVTPTHLDVTLPMSAVELRIRRAGLDLDPGYVPWFGRVVHFHYHYEVSRGESDG